MSSTTATVEAEGADLQMNFDFSYRQATTKVMSMREIQEAIMAWFDMVKRPDDSDDEESLGLEAWLPDETI